MVDSANVLHDYHFSIIDIGLVIPPPPPPMSVLGEVRRRWL